MPRPAGLAALVAVVVAAAAVLWILPRGARDHVARLTPIAGASGFEPGSWPKDPVLRSGTTGGLDVAFGYGTAAACCNYTLNLAFAPGSLAGSATIVARHGGSATTREMPVVRRWDEPRQGYAVALSVPAASPAPALCIKAVLGPSLDRLDLADGTLCVAVRDAAGACHLGTLACGLLRTH